MAVFDDLSVPNESLGCASFGNCIDYYCVRVGLTQNKLAICSRIAQPRLNKIINENIKDVSVVTLVQLCLALRLSKREAIDLLARKERAFSPIKPEHQAYLELIGIYNSNPVDYRVQSKERLSCVLDDADTHLIKRGFSELPNSDLL